LSGVGLRGIFLDEAPNDLAQRNDDESLNPAAVIDITLLKTRFGGPVLAVSPVHPEIAWGFPCHPSCWDILTSIYPKAKEHLQLLFDILRSMPHPDGLIAWGHDYGGLLRPLRERAQILPGDEPERFCIDPVDYPASASHTYDPGSIAVF
jgi:hypothetical protein